MRCQHDVNASGYTTVNIMREEIPLPELEKLGGTRLGPYEVRRTPEELTLRLDNHGDVSVKGCLFFLVGMICIVIVGVFSVIQSADSKNHKSPTDLEHMVGIHTNQSGFLWVVLTLAMVVLLPIYLFRLQHSATEFMFKKTQTENLFLKNRKIISDFAHIENLQIRETYDPDRRFLYEVELFYGDGYSLFLHNTYDEREAGNLAKEIADFINVRVVFKGT